MTRATDACIEGFPRTGNTLAENAFSESNPGLRIAHHVHAPGQVHRAAEYGIPCAVLVRNPADAVTSLITFYRGSLPEAVALAAYIAFYRSVARSLPHFVLFEHAKILEDPDVVARGLNARFGTRFAVDGSQPMASAAGQRAGPRYTQPVLPPPERERVDALRRQVRTRRLFRTASTVYADMLRALPKAMGDSVS